MLPRHQPPDKGRRLEMNAAQLTKAGWIVITEDELENGGSAGYATIALAWIDGNALRIASGLDSPVEFDFTDEDDRRDTSADNYDICVDAAETFVLLAEGDSENEAGIEAGAALAAAGIYVGEVECRDDHRVAATSNGCASHLYMRALVARTGLSQSECARRIGIEPRTFRSYLADHSQARTAARAPYPVQFTLRALARECSA